MLNKRQFVQIVSVTLFVLIFSALGFGQRVIADDSRRTIYAGETAPLSIYSLPMYSGVKSRDGFSESTASAEGFTDVWNEAGEIARHSNLKPGAVIWTVNGEANPQEGYLAGCTKSGRPFMNRIKKRNPPVIAKAAPPDDHVKVKQVVDCDEGSIWDVGRKLCVSRGEERVVCNKQGYAVNPATGFCEITAQSTNCPSDQLWDFQKRKCVKQDGGMAWWKKGLIAGALVVGTVAVVKAVDHDDNNCRTCPTTVRVPTKTLPQTTSTTSSVPIRPRIIRSFNEDGTPVYADQNTASSGNNEGSSSGSSAGYREILVNGVATLVPM